MGTHLKSIVQINKKEVSQRVWKLKQYIFSTFLGPLSDKITYSLIKPITKCHYKLELPNDFREIERQIGYISLGVRDSVVFCGEEPYFIELNKSSHSQIPESEKYLYLGHDVDGMCYAYDLSSEKDLYIVRWFIVDDPGLLKASDLEKYDGSFLDLLENKVYTHLN
jgi:hypothetical protein